MRQALQERYETVAKDIVRSVREKICVPCTNPRKENFLIDMHDPLNCACLCERVEPLLESAAQIVKGTA